MTGRPLDTTSPPEFYPEPDGESNSQSRKIIGGGEIGNNLSEGSRTSGVMRGNLLKASSLKDLITSEVHVWVTIEQVTLEQVVKIALYAGIVLP